MKKVISIFCLSALMGLNTTVFAEVNVPAGTVVPITVSQTQTSKTVTSGSSIEAKITEDVIIDNNIIFKKGDRAVLSVLSAKKAKFVGIPGEIKLSGGKIFDAKGEEHRIDFNQQITGEEKTWPKVCLGCGVFIILAPLALFGFVKGGQAEITSNQTVDVKTTSTFKF